MISGLSLEHGAGASGKTAVMVTSDSAHGGNNLATDAADLTADSFRNSTNDDHS
jgi:hypothetical protein